MPGSVRFQYEGSRARSRYTVTHETVRAWEERFALLEAV
jgi:hypothetical protein